MTREAIITALFNLLVTSHAYKTTGRRLILWTLVPEQPALFLRHTGDVFPEHPTGLLPRTRIECEAWIYVKTADPDAIPEKQMNNVLDAVERALKPPPAYENQTLGGLVTQGWIEGRVEIHPGDLDGQSIAVVPITILVPNIL